MSSSFRRYVTVDTRALAFFRLWTGLLFVYSVVRRLRYRDALFAPDGLLPPGVPSLEENLRFAPSPFWVTDATWTTVGLALSLAFPILYTLGFCTRLSSILTFLGLLALHQRLVFVETGGDIALLLVSAFACFLPLADRLSIDAWRAKSDPPKTRVAPVLLFFLFQWSFIYAVSALAKHGASWWHGTALVEALRLSRVATPVGVLVSHAPDALLRASAWGALLLELALPVFLLAPWRTDRLRAIAGLSIVGLHTGIALTLNVGVFSFAMMSIVPLLLPTRFYDRFGGRQGVDLVPSEASRTRRALFAIAFSLFALAAFYQLACERFPFEAVRRTRPVWFSRVADTVRFRQGWTLFAPQPPREDDVLVVDAVTVDGRHVDPFHAYSLGLARPLASLPGTLGYEHFFAVYEDRLHRYGDRARYEAFARWLESYPERTGRANDRIASFEATRLETSTETAKRADPRETARTHTAPIFANDGAIPITIVRSRSVLGVERTIDGIGVPTGSISSTPVAAPFASSCAYVDYDLGAPRSSLVILLLSSAESAFAFDGSTDGRRFQYLAFHGGIPGAKGQYPRVIPLRLENARYLRVRPRGLAPSSVAEIRVYEGRGPDSLAPIVAELGRSPAIDASLPRLPRRVPVFARPVADGPCEGIAHMRVVLATDSTPRN